MELTMLPIVYDRLGPLKRYLVYRRLREVKEADWQRRFRKVFTRHPDYGRPCSTQVERDHLSRWRPFRRRVNLATLRICSAISGLSHADMVPEAVYDADIEPALNRCPIATFLAHKSTYNRWFSDARFVSTYLHNVDGVYYDSDYTVLSGNELEERLERLFYPVVFKPNMNSSGGRDVFFPTTKEELVVLMRGRKNYVIQPRMKQHDFFERFNKSGLNTIRVCLYRSVRSEGVHLLGLALRMGVAGSLDNETAGGSVCYVHSNGSLNDYAVDKYGRKFASHPDSHVQFSRERPIPDLGQLRT